MPVSAIIPTLNESDWIARSVEAAFAAGAAEVIVADGGSVDATARLAKAAGARVMLCEPMRARQMNLAAGAAAHDALIFVHADTLLPAGAASAVEGALQSGARFGGFRIAFIEESWRLRWTSFAINLRTAITRAPWGDQAQFVSRAAFLEAGGFREIPIMEDYELAMRMRRHARVLPLTVRTSGRRFLRRGLLRTSATNWRIIWLYHRGSEVSELERLYRK